MSTRYGEPTPSRRDGDSTILSVGIDDTDSVRGMCTTYLAYKIAVMASDAGDTFLDYPRLVRLNPNIPWRTRGNGAVSMRIKTRDADRLKERTVELLERYSDVDNNANPGLVFLEGNSVPQDVRRLASRALWQLVPREEAAKIIEKNGIEAHTLGNGRGLVGALASAGYRFEDSTVELLSYRKRSMFGRPREIDAQSVRCMQEAHPDTFNSYDAARKRILLAPHGPDPVFYGLRGESAAAVLDASRTMLYSERPAGHMIFRSNQGTGDHLCNMLDAGSFLPYASGMIRGTVSGSPESRGRGCVTFDVRGGSLNAPCVVYRPTGLAGAALMMASGDTVTVGGGVRPASGGYPDTLNVEFIHVHETVKREVPANPECKRCKKRMKSKGRGQGFCCARCGSRARDRVTKVQERGIEPGLYLPHVSAQRHLARPEQRTARLNRGAAFDESIEWLARYHGE